MKKMRERDECLGNKGKKNQEMQCKYVEAAGEQEEESQEEVIKEGWSGSVF